MILKVAVALILRCFARLMSSAPLQRQEPIYRLIFPTFRVVRGAPALHAPGFHELVSQHGKQQQADQEAYRGAEYFSIVDHLYPQGILVAQGRHALCGDEYGVESLIEGGLALDDAIRMVGRTQLRDRLVLFTRATYH